MATTSVDPQTDEPSLPWLVALRQHGLAKEEVLKIYSDWTSLSDYDTDLLAGEYEAPLLTAKALSECFPVDRRGEVRILDIGAGTGMVARGLRAEGFLHIDALDPSESMLARARKEELYENYICEFLTDKHLPVAADTYDGVTACSCFGPNHASSNGLTEMLRLVKPGGIIVLVGRAGALTTQQEFKDGLIPAMEDLEEQGKWRKLAAEIKPRYYLGKYAIIWKYEVCEKKR